MADLTRQEVVKILISVPGASFSGADLSDLDLAGVDFRGADLTNCCLHSVNFMNANLSGCKIERSNLCRARFAGANLSRVVANGSDFSSAHFTATTNLDGLRAAGAKVDANGPLFSAEGVSPLPWGEQPLVPQARGPAPRGAVGSANI